MFAQPSGGNPMDVNLINRYLDTLLGDRSKDTLYPCIRDLVAHGLDRARFAAGEFPPSRQDLTQYLAAWSRHAGLSEEESSGWLLDYCVAKLAALSRRTPAAVRHSTKSNLRYIYRSAVTFRCQCANNRFRAVCRTDCPVYADMQAKLRAEAAEALNPKPLTPPPAPLPEPVPPVKQANLEQFQTGLHLALQESRKGTKLWQIVELLNERGLKTRTGRKWKYAILRNELLNWERTKVPPPAGKPSAGLPEGPAADPTAPTDAAPATPPDNAEGLGAGRPKRALRQKLKSSCQM